MTTKNIIREVSYKGHIITVFEDGFHQEFVIIDNDESKLYDSIADVRAVAKNVAKEFDANIIVPLLDIEELKTMVAEKISQKIISKMGI